MKIKTNVGGGGYGKQGKIPNLTIKVPKPASRGKDEITERK
jgi:hypothetical protein